MDTRGRHAVTDIWLHEYEQMVVVEAMNLMLAKYTVLQVVTQRFVPQGLTMVWVLGESHCTLHTYPEHKFIAVDLYTCSDKFDPMEDLAGLAMALDTAFVRGESFDRGISAV